MSAIWKPRNPSETAPRIHLDRIVATEWHQNGNQNELRVHLEGGHTTKLTAHEGNQLLEAWETYANEWAAERSTLMLQWMER